MAVPPALTLAAPHTSPFPWRALAAPELLPLRWSPGGCPRASESAAGAVAESAPISRCRDLQKKQQNAAWLVAGGRAWFPVQTPRPLEHEGP